MAIKNSPGYNTALSFFISFLIIKRYKTTRMNTEISPMGMNGNVIIFDLFFCFSFVVYDACIMFAYSMLVTLFYSVISKESKNLLIDLLNSFPSSVTTANL